MGTWDPKRVGAKNALWLDDVDRAIIERRHFQRRGQGECNFCKQEWPCDAAQLIHDLEATKQAFRRSATMPF